MGTIPYDSIIGSNPFRFLVGLHKREFTIHSALVAHQSRALDALVNGGMREAHDGCAIWEQVDEKTFTRFGQYMYTGDYDAADPVASSASTTKDTSSNGTDGLQDRDIDEWFVPPDEYSVVWKTKKPSYSSRRRRLWNEFENAQDYGPARCPRPRKNTDPRASYREVFLSHARLYVFADCYGISQLAQLSFLKLRGTLVAFELFDERTGDVVELLRYCYMDPVPEKLRELVVHFVACHVEKLWKNEEFQGLVEAYGELSRALVGKLLARLD
ncbi:hypothetical protein TOPH_05669 [Tolypocladium ophioglossoides CBS 100239]|uniref:BTB domain-containing protein n=1 Tax=Tolypocladium ophioglossoides (strain CBS 100239) TaxID=1163406 RepID=A0A0L0N675_TOLOC|nr:hypothetical protein TOPH_05669 [Tolypocladium ophioglossoides CBS 100239]